MEEYTIARYYFYELSDESKKVAIEREQEYQNETMPTEFLTEELRQVLDGLLGGDDYAVGLDLNYDLSYSQGSGVSFTGRLTPSNAPKLTWPEGASHANLVRTSSHYSHPYTVRTDLFDIEGEDLDSAVLDSQIKALCATMERKGYAFIDNYTSQASAVSSLEDLDAVFLESGKISLPEGVIA